MDHDHFNSPSQSPPVGLSCPSTLELAAYLDGRLSDEGSEAVETHLAACSDCLSAVAGVRQVMAEPAVPAPSAVVLAAKGLVTAPSSLGSPDHGWWRDGGILAFGRLAAGVAAAVAVCVVGYRVGATMPSGVETSDLTAELSFGLLDAAEPDDLQMELFSMSGTWGGRP